VEGWVAQGEREVLVAQHAAQYSGRVVLPTELHARRHARPVDDLLGEGQGSLADVAADERPAILGPAQQGINTRRAAANVEATHRVAAWHLATALPSKQIRQPGFTVVQSDAESRATSVFEERRGCN